MMNREDFKKRVRAMFMSRSQIIYLFNIFFQCVVWGMFSGVFGNFNNGLGTRMYSVILILGCVSSCLYCWFSCDMKKKRWIFKHFKVIDITESIFFTITELVFLIIYFAGGYNPYTDMARVLWLFFGWTMFYRFVNTILNSILPSIGDVYEQSLYKNQIDYQNHSNAEGLMSCFGGVIGAVLSYAVGDFFMYHPWCIFLMCVTDWIGFWSRWQFYFNKKNYAIIKKNFAKDLAEYKYKSKETK